MSQSNRRIDRAEIQRLIQIHGLNASVIAAEMGEIPNSIRRIMTREFGLKPHPQGQRKIDRRQLAAVTEAKGFDAAEEIAALFGVHVDSIHRIWREEFGHARRLIVTPEQQARIDVLAREGLPSTWIAEDVGLKSWTVRDRRPADGQFDTVTWRREWQNIRRNETLLELHWSVAPKTHRQHAVERILEQDMRAAA